MFRICKKGFYGRVLVGIGSALFSFAAAYTQANAPTLNGPDPTYSTLNGSPIAAPGWVKLAAQGVSPEEARQILGIGSSETDFAAPLGRSAAAFATAGDYSELAEALENDPLRIYQYVRNHFEYVPYFGLLKGPYLTLHERSGNDFDQASLLVELLRAAGIPAKFKYGSASIDTSNATALQAVAKWLGTDANLQIVASTFANGGIPVSLSNSILTFDRVWVEATTDQGVVLLDPAFKASTRYNTINLDVVMNHTEAGILGAAGGTASATSVQGLNAAALANYLRDRSTNLLNYLKAHHANDAVEEVFGGYKIVTDNSETLPTSLPLSVTASPLTWEVVPASFMHTLRITHGNLDITRNIPDIAGRKVSLTYSGSGQNAIAMLSIDDKPVGQGAPPANDKLRLVVNHPYAADGGTFGDQSRDFPVKRTGSYVIVSAFGGDRNSTLLGERQRLLNRMSVDGTQPDATKRLTETLNIIGQTWMQQTQLNADMLYTISGKRSIAHHRFGIAGQEQGYFIDMAAQVLSVSNRVATATQGEFKADAFVASAMEHSVLDQLQGVSNSEGLGNPAVSTIRLLALANWKGDRLFVTNGGNYTVVSPYLRNYSSDDMARFQMLSAAAHTLVIPEDGAISVNQWKGHGYVQSLDTGQGVSVGMIIAGGLNGGISTKPGPPSPVIVQKEFIPEITLRREVPVTPAQDPVDLGTGAFISSNTDFGVSGSGTRGFAFTRSYNSQMASQDTAGLGRGWTHNYNIYIAKHSNIEAALGERTLFDVIPMVVVNHIARSLLQAQAPTPRNWGVAALVANWGMDQLLNKTITVHIGSQALTYQEMPSGEFVPPAGITTQLVRLSNNTYELRERFGTVWKFDSQNRVASIVDVDGKIMSFSYNVDGRLTQVKDAHSRILFLRYVNDDLVQAYDSTYHSVSYAQANGNLTGVAGLDGSNWLYEYDNFHRLLKVTNPVGVKMVHNTYNDFDRVTAQFAPRDTGLETYKMHYGGFVASEEDPEGNRTTYHFDLHGRRVAIEDALRNTSRMVYDGQGHVIGQTDPRGNSSTFVYDGFGNLKEQINSIGNKVTFTYDTEHRLAETKGPLSQKVTYKYNAKHRITDSADPLGHSVKTSYLANGLVNSLTDPRAINTAYTYDTNGYIDTTQTGSNPAINWNYDSRGNLESLVDGKGAKTSFIYYNNGLLKERLDPLGKKSLYEYTAAGELKKSTDRNNKTTQFSYTGSGRLKTMSYPGSAVNFNYDSRDKLVEMIDSTGTTTNTYDAAGRLTGHTDSSGHSVGYSYDAVGNLTTLTYPPGNKTVSYTYDNLNRLSTVKINWLSGKPTMRYVYDDANRLDRVEHFNAMETDYSWDDADRLTGIAHEGPMTLVEYSFQLDANGNRIQEVISPAPMLSGSLLTDDISFTYNHKHNRLNSTSTHNYVFDEQGQLFSTIDTLANRYTYDDEGQLTAKNAMGYSFDEAHRLVQRGSDSFVYDGVGNRLKAIRGAAPNRMETQYIYDASGNLLAQANSAGQISRYYIYGAGLAAMVQSNTYYVYHFDGTGHTVALTNANNMAVNKYSYSPYGKVLSQEQVTQPFKYAGQVGIFTESDNLYYMRARYYDAETGRFISEDPAGFVDGPNLYEYVRGNPIMGVDPSGLFSFLVSRPLNSVLGVVANHNFIVSNARYIGDPNATIFSFGNTGNGTMGSVNNVDTGPAANTFEQDVAAWQSLASGNSDVTYRFIRASDISVEVNAKQVVSGASVYTYIPGLQGGTNSNSAAGAVATRSDGGIAWVNNNALQPGRHQHGRVTFGCQ
jgi:RHS repeat-associated protein